MSSGYLDSIANITVSDEIQLAIFCSDGFIIQKESPADHQQYWWDIEFHDNNSTEPVSLPIQDGELPSPTEKTFTKLGYNAGIDQNATGQAHIYISPNTFNLSQSPSVDGRNLADIRTEGLKADKNFNNIDYLRPLSRSIMRELFVAVGGLLDPNLNMTRVIDIPGENTDISMFKDCIAQKNQNPAPITIAECLTIVATGLFLQIHDTPTFWSTGVVNRDTLRAEEPGNSSSQDITFTLN
ncbi:uncharacterized protein GGS22DRAFT_194113 [Annulohypoxylon maeteangense]|uniref:uncharacterized protein n=1 Tax=Annulohypoxylon maeteangense TaxID=1927788 RepID=UPI002008D4DB|nr:uncharacterized protein GGS22DRAFT_194113 [Annulohypoxylon maeteangense]KAI0889758.1 hypothetical protein GGS22DRAFT_194113 [Annulohypoxylon maeteangense]